MRKSLFLYILTTGIILFLGSCKDEDDTPGSLFFSIEDDKQLGAQVAQEIENDPAQFPIMPETTEDQRNAYNYLRNNILAPILASEDVQLENDFAYNQIKIIADDQTLNAFATPGGYIYVYAGLILYLDVEDHLAGVLGHEIAHAERRHSIKQLEKQYGLSLLLSVVAGENSGTLTQIAGQLAGTLAGLAFSRDAESEADEFAVKYTSDTEYSCNGVAGFFQKLEDENAPRPPEFLSTHPNPDTRIQDINNFANSIGCDKTENQQANYAQFQQWVFNGIQ